MSLTGTAVPRIVFVTGTDTGVGKTIVAAALAAALISVGRSVVVYKPTQAGLEHGAGDIDVVRRLAGVEVHEGIRLPDPMAPVAAARRAGMTLPTAAEHVATIRRLAADHDHTLVEGAGGILVQLSEDGHTLADLAAAATRRRSHTTGAMVACRATLGTLNHTELTVEALTRRGIAIAGLVIGSWPREPTPVDLSNREYLSRHTVPLLAAIPEQAGDLNPAQFRAAAETWLQSTVDPRRTRTRATEQRRRT
jgi:dethiobiotin synthetase